jgi:putative aldouronate transport system permease protein
MREVAMNQRSTSISLPKHGFIRKVIINRQFLLLLAPGVFYLLIFAYLPMPGLVIAFKDLVFSEKSFIANLLNSKWHGLRNFEIFFKSKDALMITRNTVLYNIVFIFLGLVLSVTLSIIMTELRNRRTAKVYQTILIFPGFISWVVVSYLVYSILEPNFGTANQLLKSIGMNPVSWYTRADLWPFLLVLFKCWKSLGMSAVFYIAAMSGIDQEMYQAAQIDGAGKWQQIWAITIPCLRPTMTLLTIMALGGIISTEFGLFWTTTLRLGKGALYSVASTIDTYLYQQLMVNNRYGLSAAVGFFQAVVGFVMICSANYFIGKLNPDGTRLF